MLFLFWFYHLSHIFLPLCLRGCSLSCDLLAFLVCFWCGETSSSSQPLLVACWGEKGGGGGIAASLLLLMLLLMPPLLLDTKGKMKIIAQFRPSYNILHVY